MLPSIYRIVGSLTLCSLSFFILPEATALPGTSVVLSESSLVTTEDGESATFEVTLSEVPDGSVDVNFSSGDLTEGSLSNANLTFTPADWDIPQTVTVNPGASGDGNDGDVMYSISGTVDATGTNFDGAPVPSVNVTNINTEGISTIIFSNYQNHETDEDGTTSTFTVRLSSTPSSGTVSVELTSNDPDEVLISTGMDSPGTTATVVMDSTTPVVVTITGQDDGVADGDQPFSISIGNTVATDPSYDDLPNSYQIRGTNSTIAAYQPDLRVGKKFNPAVHKGNQIYSNRQLAIQTLRDRASRDKTTKFFLSLENDGSDTDQILLRSGNFLKQKRRYKMTFTEIGGSRISPATLASGITKELGAGETAIYRGTIRLKKRVKARERQFRSRITTTSLTDPSKADTSHLNIRFK
ncbi:MAG: hypothetical protein CMO55_06160 [Verrucomicrobiales bacterium]|nr:hypothetical protein [Verrucomicrobiales bacterium]